MKNFLHTNNSFGSKNAWNFKKVWNFMRFYSQSYWSYEKLFQDIKVLNKSKEFTNLAWKLLEQQTSFFLKKKNTNQNFSFFRNFHLYLHFCFWAKARKNDFRYKKYKSLPFIHTFKHSRKIFKISDSEFFLRLLNFELVCSPHTSPF